MIEFFNDNIYSFWFAIGFLLLVIEALALGFSTGFILFIGLGALLTGGAIWFELVPATWLSSIATFALSSVFISLLLWKPLRAIQRNSKPPKKDNSSDIIGLLWWLKREISTTAPGITRYSGVEWQVVIDHASEQQMIAAGTMVVVVSVDAGTFWVDVDNK